MLHWVYPSHRLRFLTQELHCGLIRIGQISLIFQEHRVDNSYRQNIDIKHKFMQNLYYRIIKIKRVFESSMLKHVVEMIKGQEFTSILYCINSNCSMLDEVFTWRSMKWFTWFISMNTKLRWNYVQFPYTLR